MYKYETIKIDVSFPDFRATQLEEKLYDGYEIVDKTVLKDRYIFYVLRILKK